MTIKERIQTLTALNEVIANMQSDIDYIMQNCDESEIKLEDHWRYDDFRGKKNLLPLLETLAEKI